MYRKSLHDLKVILLNLPIVCAAKSRLGAHWNSSRRRFFANSTRLVRKRMTLQSPNASSAARPNWRRSASKFKILSKQSFGPNGSESRRTTDRDLLKRAFSLSCSAERNISDYWLGERREK